VELLAMKNLHVTFSALALTVALASSAQAGCLKGAIVGGIGGHFAHHHGFIGAAAGCAVGHHMAVEKKRREEEQKRAYQEHRGAQGDY
jgi:hypothetical protein